MEQENLPEDNYKVYIDYETLKNMPTKIEGLLEVAKIRNVTRHRDIMFVFYDKNYYVKTNHMMSSLYLEENGKREWCVIIRDEFLELLKKNPKLCAFGLFHELGHFINGDIGKPADNISEIRREYIKNGKVLEMEINADKFAVSKLGKNHAIKFIDYRIMRRKEIDNSELAIKELELRKNYIKRM